MWLTKKLAADFKTIADLRLETGAGFREVCRRFTVLCRELKYFGGRLVAIDDSEFNVANSKRRTWSARKFSKPIREADEQYLKTLGRADSFGTIKTAMGSESLLARGLESVQTEVSLTVLAYNLMKAMNILGTRGLIAAMG